MTKKKSPRRLPQAERRAQLLSFAVEVAARTGLGRLCHADVAHDAGVAVSTAFLYFPNRQALVSAVIAEVCRFYVAMSRACHTADVPAPAALHNHLRTYADSVDTHPEYARIWLEWSTAVRNEAGVWDTFLDYQEQLVKTLAATIRRGQRAGAIPGSVSAQDAARLIAASAYTITQLKFTHRGRTAINRFIDQVVGLALRTGVDPAPRRR